jgi:hypothetical protein
MSRCIPFDVTKKKELICHSVQCWVVVHGVSQDDGAEWKIFASIGNQTAVAQLTIVSDKA